MKKQSAKTDNRKALPKFLLTLLAAAVFGGILGFGAGWLGHDHLSDVIVSAVVSGVVAAAPWALLGTCGVSLLLVIWLYTGARRLFSRWDGEDESIMEQAEEKLSWGLLVASVQAVLGMFLFSAAVMGQDLGVLWSIAIFLFSEFSMIVAQQKIVDLTRTMNVLGMFLFSAAVMGQDLGVLWSIAIFLFSEFSMIVAQQKIVDLTRTMNPEKRGSVYDSRFQKTWFESCDEAEQKQIGQAAYKAFRTVSGACGLLWVVLILLGYAFNISILLPVFLLCLLWLVLNVSYCLESIRLGRHCT